MHIKPGPYIMRLFYGSYGGFRFPMLVPYESPEYRHPLKVKFEVQNDLIVKNGGAYTMPML